MLRLYQRLIVSKEHSLMPQHIHSKRWMDGCVWTVRSQLKVLDERACQIKFTVCYCLTSMQLGRWWELYRGSGVWTAVLSLHRIYTNCASSVRTHLSLCLLFSTELHNYFDTALREWKYSFNRHMALNTAVLLNFYVMSFKFGKFWFFRL